MRVLVADDQAAVRSAVRRLLNEEPGYSVVGEAVRAEELLSEAQATQPDLVLLDWELPGLSSAFRRTAQRVKHRLLDALHALHSRPTVIALSGHPEAHQAALDAGVDAFVSKGDPPERLLAALRTINMRSGGGGDLTQVIDIIGATRSDNCAVAQHSKFAEREGTPDERCSGRLPGQRAQGTGMAVGTGSRIELGGRNRRD